MNRSLLVSMCRTVAGFTVRINQHKYGEFHLQESQSIHAKKEKKNNLCLLKSLDAACAWLSAAWPALSSLQ